MSKSYFLLCLVVCLSVDMTCFAQYSDPIRATAIKRTTDHQKKAFKAQMEVQELNTTGHIWLESMVSSLVEFNTEFDNYLNQPHDLLTQSAELYGLYYETKRLITHIKKMGDVIESSPSNGLAVALSTKKNYIYRNLISTTLDIVGDIKDIFYKSKMTEKEKFKAILDIRPKLKLLNTQLHRTILAVKYTSLKDVWYEISNRHYKPKSKTEIARKCIREWKQNVGMRG